MRLIFACLLLAAVAGCDYPINEPDSYTPARYTLLDAALPPDAGITEIGDDTVVLASDGLLLVNSCNTCEGRYAWEDDNLLRVPSLGCTEIACGSRLDLGTWLFADRIVASDAEEDEITLVAERGGLLASFRFRVEDLATLPPID